MKPSLLPILALAGVSSADPATTKAPDCQSVILIPAKFTFGPIKTVWTTTSTTTSTIDCTPCGDGVKPTYLPLGPGPVVFFTTTTTVATPSIATDYKCVPGAGKGSPTTGGNQEAPKVTSKPDGVKPPPPNGFVTKTVTFCPDKDGDEEPGCPPELGPKTAYPPGNARPVCTTSTYVNPYIPDATSTVFKATVTSTRSVDCHGCALVWSTGVINYFAPHIYTSTVTARKPSTKVELACSPTKA